MLRAIPLLSALVLLLSSPSQAALVSAAPASLPPATSENASTAFFEGGSESRIGLLCHNDPVNKADPTGLRSWDTWSYLMWQQSGTTLSFAQFQQQRQFSSWQAAGLSRVQGVIGAVQRYKMEHWSPFGVDDKTGQRTAASVLPGNGLETQGEDKGLQTSTIGRGDLPANYRLEGFVLGHIVFNTKMIQDDFDTAKRNSLHAIIVTPPRLGSTNREPVVIIYDYTKPSPPF
jgi:hypothetical protein